MTAQSFDANPTSVRAARHFLRTSLGGVGDQGDVAELLLSELVTNVVRHARTRFTVELFVESDRLRAVVEDGAAVDIAIQDLRDNVDSGRGLRVLDALADKWGVTRTSSGKQVWFEIGLGNQQP